MAAGPWVGAATAAAASAYMAKAQADADARKHEEFMRMHMDLYAPRPHRTMFLTGPRVEPTPAKCACCGSHEFRKHAERMICAYCRTDGRK